MYRRDLFMIKASEPMYFVGTNLWKWNISIFKQPYTDIFLVNFNLSVLHMGMQPSDHDSFSFEVRIPIKKRIDHFEIYDRLSLVW